MRCFRAPAVLCVVCAECCNDQDRVLPMTQQGVWEPCDWPVPAPTCCDAWDRATLRERRRATRMARSLLWAATGRQLGRCPHVLRPCRKEPAASGGCGSGGNTWTPVLDAGRWFNVRCGCGGHSCSCSDVCEVWLPGLMPEPVRVTIDGQDVPLSGFEIHDAAWLVRVDGECFPDCNDLSLPVGSVGTWEVEYTSGYAVPPEGQLAASSLACELVKACSDDGGECRLPDNVKEVHRQGVDIVFQDQAATAGAQFNIPHVDAWVRSLNPHGVISHQSVYSPDVSPGRMVTWRG